MQPTTRYLSDLLKDAVKKKRLNELLPIIKEVDEIYYKIPDFQGKYNYFVREVEKRYKQQ